MASPLLHSFTGAWLSRAIGSRAGRAGRVLAVAAIACLPDLDLIPGLLQGDAFRHHHGPTHSLGAALAVAVALSVLGFGGSLSRPRAAMLVGLAYASHLILDLVSYDAFAGDGIGIPLLWPVSDARVIAPVHLFFFGIAPDARGLLDGVVRRSNVWGLVWELGIVLLAMSLANFVIPGRRGASTAPRPARSRAAAGGAAAALLLLASCPHLGGNVVEDLKADDDEAQGRIAGMPDPRPEVGADSSLAGAPLSPSAREWIVEHRALIREVADGLGVSPVSLAGVVAAERTLLRDPFDASVDALFSAYFATLSEGELRSWVSRQETAYQRALRSFGDPGLRSLKNPYLWSVGPSQVSFRNAVFYEPRLSRLQKRSERPLREIVAALLSARGSLEYAAVILLDAQEAYARYADLDVRERPGVLATLYHLGSPARRAIRLGEENRRRQLAGEPAATPRLNFYGAFVDRHAAELEGMLR